MAYYYVARSTKDDFTSVYQGTDEAEAERIARELSFEFDIFMEIFDMVEDKYALGGLSPAETRKEAGKYYNGEVVEKYN
jgi:hypothetical protein